MLLKSIVKRENTSVAFENLYEWHVHSWHASSACSQQIFIIVLENEWHVTSEHATQCLFALLHHTGFLEHVHAADIIKKWIVPPQYDHLISDAVKTSTIIDAAWPAV